MTLLGGSPWAALVPAQEFQRVWNAYEGKTSNGRRGGTTSMTPGG